MRSTTSSPPKPPLTTFHLFPLLPVELRLKIWQHARLLFPRVLTLLPIPWNDTLFPSSLPPDFRSSAKWSLSPSCIAPLLSVCAESRGEVLPFYDVRFKQDGVAENKGRRHGGNEGSGMPWEVPVCLETDMLHVNVRKSVKMYDGTISLFCDLFGDEASKVVKNVRRLAGSERFWACMREGNVFDEFERLEEALLVVPSRTMRLLGNIDVKSGEVGGGTGVVRRGEGDEGRGRVEVGMRMCAAGDLGRVDGKGEVECDFMSSGTDIYVFA